MITDNDRIVWVAVITVVGAAVPGVLALLQGRKNHKLMNSRLTELLEISKKASKAEGVIEGAADEKEKAAQLRAAE